MIGLEEKAYTDNMWKTCKYYFKDLYTNQKRYNKATKKIGFESAENVREKNIVSEDSTREIFEELSKKSRVYKEYI